MSNRRDILQRSQLPQNETDLAEDVSSPAPEAGCVRKVRDKWLVFEDGAFAQRLQQEEFHSKYQFNKVERVTARTDAPLAKIVQTEEERRLQQERYELIERQQAIAKRDAELAEQVHKLEKEKTKFELKNLEVEDHVIAAQLQQEELLKLEHDRIKNELKDQEYAHALYEKERKAYEQRLLKKQLARERKRLEEQQQQDSSRLLSGYKPETNLSQQMGSLNLDESEEHTGLLRTDGRIEDLGDFSDFYILPNEEMQPHERKQLQEFQDEELALLLQDQEKKRGAQIDKTQLKTLEDRDAELARIMQEQERLRAKRSHRSGGRHHSHEESQSSHDAAVQQCRRQRSDPSTFVAENRHHRRYQQQNSINEAMNESNSPPGSFNNPSPIYRDQVQSPYSQRPLPRTPMEMSSDRITVVPVMSESEQRVSPPPGYKPPPAYPNQRRHDNEPAYPNQHHHHHNESSYSHQHSHNSKQFSNHSNDTSPTSNNVIAAIDPTFRGHIPVSSSLQQTTPPHYRVEDLPLPTRRGRHSPSGTTDSHQHLEEPGYCDLDELGPVQGQKRSPIQRDGRAGSKRSSCKQQ